MATSLKELMTAYFDLAKGQALLLKHVEQSLRRDARSWEYTKFELADEIKSFLESNEVPNK